MIKDENVIFTVMHKINRDNKTVELSDIDNDDVVIYISNLMTDILDNMNYRHYRIRRSTSEVVKLSNESVLRGELNDEEKNSIAKRYLESEIIGNEKAKKFKKQVKKGFLVQALLEIDDKFYFFISKVEINDYLDVKELHKRGGLPYEDKALKTCIFVYDKDKNLLDIMIADKQHASYWFSDFLELDECTDNETSTINLFTIIERKIRCGTNESPADYYSLRNSLISYFQTPKRFQYDDMVNAVFEGYEAVKSDNVCLDKIKKTILSDITKKKLDTEFSIVPSVVKKKFKKNIKVNSFVNLQIDGADENYATMITAFEEDNKKYLKIEAEEDAFNAFSR